MKDDLISRQAAIDALDGKIEITGRTNAEAVKVYVRLVKDRLERLPSAQPDIVRCKECRNWDITWTNDWAPNYHYCPMLDGIRRDDFYCADAERRTDG